MFCDEGIVICSKNIEKGTLFAIILEGTLQSDLVFYQQ